MEHKTLWPLLGVSLLGIVLLGLTAAFVTGPQRTLLNIHQAVVHNDPEQLAQYVDFQAVREDAKSAIAKELQAHHKGPTPDPSEQASLLLGMTLADSILEQMLTPQSVIALLGEKQHLSSFSASDTADRLRKYSSVDFVDASTALVHVHDGRDALLDVRMHRSGLSWKVVGFSVPEGRADH